MFISDNKALIFAALPILPVSSIKLLRELNFQFLEEKNTNHFRAPHPLSTRSAKINTIVSSKHV